MAKDIIIQDEYYRTNHMSGVTRLRTELEDGGVCYWIPEDEAMELMQKTITENGTYAAMEDDVNGYSAVVVNVPNVFGEHDEGRVVKSGALVDQSSRTITINGIYDTTTNNSVTVETSSNLSTKTITVNGTYQASYDNVDGYSDVTVSVPNTYTQSDEGKVVNNSELVSQSSRTITVNGTYDTTLNNSVTVETSSNLSTKTITVNGTYEASTDNVDGYSDVIVSVPNTYTQSDEGKVVNNSELVSQSSRTITVNGTYDTTTNNSVIVETSSNLSTKIITVNGTYQASSDNADGYSDVIVSVPNTYTQSDEGKVVNNSELVSQSSRTITINGIYDTTTNNSVTVETSSNLSTKTITVNGTYEASTDNVDGYSDVTVSVPNTYTQSDEGKVVNNSELVSQSSRTITVNGTYDTTFYDAIEINVQPDLIDKTFSENGTYNASDYGHEGFSTITVSVETGELAFGYFDHNGTYYAADYNSPGFSTVVVTVPSIDISVIDRTITYYSNDAIYRVGKYAFAGCEYLTSLTLASCVAIESSAFYGCQSLTSLCLLDPYNCVALYEDPFSNSNIPMIYVNQDLVSDYKNDHYWGLYSDYIMPYEE